MTSNQPEPTGGSGTETERQLASHTSKRKLTRESPSGLHVERTVRPPRGKETSLISSSWGMQKKWDVCVGWGNARDVCHIWERNGREFHLGMVGGRLGGEDKGTGSGDDRKRGGGGSHIAIGALSNAL